MAQRRRYRAQPGTIIIEIVWNEGDAVEQALGTNLDAIAPEPREPVVVVAPVGMFEGRVLEKHPTGDDQKKRLVVEIPQVCQPFIDRQLSIHRAGQG